MDLKQAQLAKRWKVSQPYISRLVKRGMPLKSEADAARWLAEDGKRPNIRAEEIITAALGAAAASKPSPFIVESLAQINDNCSEIRTHIRNVSKPAKLRIEASLNLIQIKLLALASALGVDPGQLV
jgi:hypothetical protein